MSCVPCGRGFHDECARCQGKKKCHLRRAEAEPVVLEGKTITPPVAERPKGASVPKAPKKRVHGGTAKELKDPKSTGRKRAAILYPLSKDDSCEWRGKKNCGGGKRPIIGCISGLQEHRHHGPVKDTTRNHEGNVHRICTRCLVPGTRLLTPTMEWVPIENLKVGDSIVGFDNDPSSFAYTTIAQVTAVTRALEPCYKLVLEDGTEIISSHAHEWVGDKYSILSSSSERGWRTTESLEVGTYLRQYVKPWDKKLDTFEAGWLSGMYDGEGCLQRNRLVITQSLGNTSQKLLEVMHSLNFNPDIQEVYPSNSRHKFSVSFYLNNRDEVMRMLGLVQPARLLETSRIENYLSKSGTRSRKIKVVSVEYVGEQEVIALSSSSGTYIAEGLLSKNCHNHWHELNDLVYEEGSFALLPHDPMDATPEEIYKEEIEWSDGTKRRMFELASSKNKSKIDPAH